MYKKVLTLSLILVFGLFASFLTDSILNSSYFIASVFASAEQGTESCDCDEEGGGVVGLGCTPYYFHDGPIEFVCCSSEGASPIENCNCAEECNTPYHPEPCDIQS